MMHYLRCLLLTGSIAPAVRKPGAIALEQTGVTHWWENTGSTTAKALVVDIVPAK